MAKNVLHKESVLWVVGASVQARFLHCVPVQKHGVVVVVPPDTKIALFPLQILVVRKSEQYRLATQILFHPHPLEPVQVIDLIVSKHPASATQPDPVVTHPVW